MKITFLGGGNMATALIGGLRKQGYSTAAIQVVEPQAEQRERLSQTLGVRCCPGLDAAALNCEVLVLAVKPQQMQAALAPLRTEFAAQLRQQLVISIAAGLRLEDLSRWLGGHRQLVRCMPNTPALIGAGITGLYADAGVSHEGRNTAAKVLDTVGQTLWVDTEDALDAVTAISGSGPAYVFYFIEALQQAGCELGLSAATARQLALQTFAGATQLALQSEATVSQLRQQVTSKGGTTAAALDSFAQDDIAAAILRGAQAAARRGRQMAQEMGRDTPDT